jgi:hypothetical protein
MKDVPWKSIICYITEDVTLTHLSLPMTNDKKLSEEDLDHRSYFDRNT